MGEHRATRGTRARFRILAGVVTAAALAAGCSSDAAPGHAGPLVPVRTWVAGARFPVAPIALADGGLLYGERLTGRVRRVGADGHLVRAPAATVPAVGAANDQRGLLGLTRTPDGRLFASWTGADGRLVVGEVAGADGGPPRILWTGPPSSDRANGGTLAVDRDGRLLIGIGDLLADRALGADPTVPNRKVLALDPDGGPTQTPRVLSTGWSNPYALVVTATGTPWVADNAGGRSPERIGRADRPETGAAILRADHATVAPAALVELGPGRLGVCGFVSGRLDEYRIVGDGARRTGRTTAAPCRLGAVVLADGRLVTLGLHAILRSVAPLDPATGRAHVTR